MEQTFLGVQSSAEDRAVEEKDQNDAESRNDVGVARAQDRSITPRLHKLPDQHGKVRRITSGENRQSSVGEIPTEEEKSENPGRQQLQGYQIFPGKYSGPTIKEVF